MVNSRTGSAELAAADAQALGAGGEVAADRVDARVQARRPPATSTPSPTSASSSAWLSVPGSSETARQPTPGVRLEAAPHGRAGGRRARRGGRCRRCARTGCSTPSSMSTLRRVARPSPSVSVAVKARGSVGSSTRVSDGGADLLAEAVGEQRPALQHGLAGERAAEDAEELGGDLRVEHDGDPLAGGLGGAEQAGGPVGRRRPRPRRRRGRRARGPTEKPKPVWVSPPSLGQHVGGDVAGGLAAGGADAGGGDHGARRPARRRTRPPRRR